MTVSVEGHDHTGFQFGHPAVPATTACCGKPLACMRVGGGCLYMGHPRKRALAGDKTVRCPCKCVRPHPETAVEVEMQCVLFNRHDGECDPQPLAMAAS